MRHYSTAAEQDAPHGALPLFVLAAIAAFLIAFWPVPAQASAEFQYEADGQGGICITGMEGDTPSELAVPAELDGMPVRSIGAYAFAWESGLQTVALPDGLANIEEGAFYGCSALASAQLPASVSQIGENAFAHCSALSSAALPAGLASLGKEAFWHCSSLTEVSVPDALTVLPEGAFGYCTSLSFIALNSSLTEIGPMALAGTALESLELPHSVESLGSAVFNACPSLESLTLSDSLAQIPEEMASDCSALKEIIVPPSVQSIGAQAFSHCSALEAVRLPAGLKSIGEMTFWSCASLSSVYVPDGVKVIAYGTFWDCSSLDDITLPASIELIEGMAFYGTRLSDVYFDGTKEQWDALKVDGEGWTQTGFAVADSNSLLLSANIHFEEDDLGLPPGVRLRAYSRLWLDKTTDLGTLLRGAALKNAPDGLAVKDILGQFIFPATVSAGIMTEGGQDRPADAPVATGNVLTMEEQGEAAFCARIVVEGDVLGTGQMSLSQVVRIAAAFTGIRPLSGVYLLAGDLTQSGRIDLTDVVREAQLFRAVRTPRA